ncbi:uncharacterized protein LOC118362892 isoform X1 [Oncorhynchus keta]|uniref:uncharacterized protein LOC118362892 isoform X1 n=1 Tax=Oncorhynchus keta TaxID=8018 RepID=UPI0015FCC28E|nr:uncharacterized protein LOC118362892 isoform X1 [Oncorhynchus keta]XP_035599502.1 uncharacterized protein LOC118362892 isoform X1 [Oncorhynchus keta]XP_035599503.1 uncharacterized protein LOC118362892 isoform X1 [Oncorhynchus keta]XP_035599504.1 uncharacterized protein LOC118362892 isoform X1 [Oncorhynchus keta]
MFCMLWIIFQTMALLVAAGGQSSGSGEGGGGGGNGGVVNGGIVGNAVNPGVMNGLALNGRPFLAQVVPVGGSLLIQQSGALGQAAMPQLVPIGALQQGGALPVEQVGAANGMPLQQGQLPQLANGVVPLFAVLPQANGIGGPQASMLMQIIPVGGGINIQQPAAGGKAGKARVKHSVPFHGMATSTRTNTPLTKVTTGEVEESSGSDSPVNAEVRLSISNLDSILTRVAKFW